MRPSDVSFHPRLPESLALPTHSVFSNRTTEADTIIYNRVPKTGEGGNAVLLDNISANIGSIDFSKSKHTDSQKVRTNGLWKGL